MCLWQRVSRIGAATRVCISQNLLFTDFSCNGVRVCIGHISFLCISSLKTPTTPVPSDAHLKWTGNVRSALKIPFAEVNERHS